jgi:hypothetical protein
MQSSVATGETEESVMTYKSRAYVQISRHGDIYLFHSAGFWVGPELGDFRTVAQAKAWGRANGYIVAHKVESEV